MNLLSVTKQMFQSIEWGGSHASVWSLGIDNFHQFLTMLKQFRFHENIYPELLLPGQVASEANKKLNEKVFFIWGSYDFNSLYFHVSRL